MSDPFSPPYPYWHHTTISRLKSILEHGLLSPNEAKRLKIKGYRRKFKSSWNDDFVSLMSNQSSRKTTAPGVAILVDPNVEIVSAMGKHQKEDTNRPIPKEVLVKDRVPPEKFVGITIGEVGWSFKLEKAVKPRPTSTQKVTEIVKNSGLNLPVYFKGHNLIWII